MADEDFDDFCAEFSGYFLVVRLDDFSSQLAAGFQASRLSDPSGQPNRSNTISFWVNLEERTVTASMSLGLRRPSIAQPSMPAASEFNSAPDLLQSACHVLQVRKRKAAPPLSMVSVGRGPENDIVLQHPSVSKLHANFELDAEELLLVDAGSRNHSYVNGEMITAKVPVKAGDAIKFGAVRCSVCSPAGLWRAVCRR